VQLHFDALAVILRSAWLISRACAPTAEQAARRLSMPGDGRAQTPGKTATTQLEKDPVVTHR
jgi:hypothetical protein